MVEANLKSGSWLVLVAHEVGRCVSQSMPQEVLRGLCRYAAARDGLWFETVRAIGSHLAQRRNECPSV
jgi:hypothetical protein